MAKRDDKHSVIEDYLDQIKWIIGAFHHSLLQVAMNNGQILAYWRELPYRGQPSKKPPKPRKRVRNPINIRRAYFNLTLAISIVAILILVLISFLPPDNQKSLAEILIFGLITLLLMIGVAKSIDAWNKHLRADDLDGPQDADEKQEE